MSLGTFVHQSARVGNWYIVSLQISQCEPDVDWLMSPRLVKIATSYC